jgi:hypothetical protein
MTKVDRRLLHYKLHRYNGESTRTEQGLMAKSFTEPQKLGPPKLGQDSGSLDVREKYTCARSFYEAVGYRLESERQKQIITLKAPLGDGDTSGRRMSRSADPGRGEGTSS